MNNTPISWTEMSWNPVTGCTPVSAACQNCYARDMATRLHAMRNPMYTNGFKVTLHPEKLYEPMYVTNPRRIFVCSMSDLFHADVPDDFIVRVLEVMQYTPQHTYQILTKRADRMAEFFSSHPVPENAWVGVTVEVTTVADRLEWLRRIDAPVRWVSAEPLLEDISGLDFSGINWIVCGGESGSMARRMDEAWAWNLKLAADKVGAAFFFKQWGSIGVDGVRRSKKNNGSQLKGQEYKNYPSKH